MKIFNKILTIIIAILIINAKITANAANILSNKLTVTPGQPIKIGVLLYRFDDVFISEVRKSLEDIQKQNPEKVEFVFFDGKGDQTIQNEDLDIALQQGSDLLLVNLVDIGAVHMVIDKIKETNVPVILFNREPATTDAIKSYTKAIFIGTNAAEAGILQGKIIANAWNANKSIMDRNRNNTLQYVMLQGQRNNLEAIARTQYSISTIQEAGIRTLEIALRDCNWNRGLARNVTEALFLRNGREIEAIIANNDDMAIGAIEALQKYGYNKGKGTITIPVVGVDAIPEARDLIKKGIMMGSVIQDAPAMAKALYICGMNLVNGKNAIEGTEYKFDNTGVSIRIPYGGIYDNLGNK